MDRALHPSIFRGLLDMAWVVPTAPLSRRWFNGWGATRAEIAKPLPGDEIVPSPRLSYTRAISIDAPPSAVWPWLVQIGQGRGGLYSYDGLENLVGCELHSADTILAEHQRLAVGDHVLFGPAEKNFPGQVVLDVIPQRALVMCALHPETRLPERSATWVFVLEPEGAHGTRLLVRGRNGYASGVPNHVAWHVVEPVAFVMERRMLRGIKLRAERSVS
ncbi:MAG: hypothetical protein U0353_05175 [Sandaracinus sp.]